MLQGIGQGTPLGGAVVRTAARSRSVKNAVGCRRLASESPLQSTSRRNLLRLIMAFFKGLLYEQLLRSATVAWQLSVILIRAWLGFF